MSSDLHLNSTARNLVSVSGFGYGANARLRQMREGEPAAAPRIKRFKSAALGARLSFLRVGTLRPC